MDKKMIFRGIMDLFGACIAVYVLWSVNKINDLVESDIRKGVQIEQMQATLTSIETSLASIASSLEPFIIEKEVQARMEAGVMRDSWSAGCMSDHDHWWLKELQKIFGIISESIDVDLHLSADDLPPIREIQQNRGFY